MTASPNARALAKELTDALQGLLDAIEEQEKFYGGGTEIPASKDKARAALAKSPALLDALEQPVTAEEVKQASLQCARVPVQEFWGCVAAAINRAKGEQT